MFKKKKKPNSAQEARDLWEHKINTKIEELGSYTHDLYLISCDIQEYFNKIRNIPTENKIEYEKYKKIRSNWSYQVEKIENDYKKLVVKNTGAGIVGVGTGAAVVAMGPTAAMGVATTFGVASTGTAISTLSGAAATNAALAWLGGGALSIGGGGILGGHVFLAMAGPVGWNIALSSIILTMLSFIRGNKFRNIINHINKLILIRDIRKYKLAIVEINERINRIISETRRLQEAKNCIVQFGFDYNAMTEEQQYALGAYVNLLASSTQLLVNPILGLQAVFTLEDLNQLILSSESKKHIYFYTHYENLIVSFVNELYKIDLTHKEKKAFYKSIRRDKEILKSLNITKKEFTFDVFNAIDEALLYVDNNCLV